MLLPTMKRWIPEPLRRTFVNFAPLRSVKTIKRITDFIENTSREILLKKRKELKELATEENDERSIDMLAVLCMYYVCCGCGKLSLKSLVVKANERADAKEKLSDSEVIGQITYAF
jgi:hypothetical protein